MAKKKDIFLEQQRKNQIIFSTYKFLVEDSVANLTLDRIASACKISKGLVSYYFKNKDNLILETMTFIMGQEKQKLLKLKAQVQYRNGDSAGARKTFEVLFAMRFNDQSTFFAMKCVALNFCLPFCTLRIVEGLLIY